MENMAPTAPQDWGLASRPGEDPGLLTQQELEAYHRDGFVVPRFRLPKDEAARLRGLILRLVAENPDYADTLMQGAHIVGNPMQPLKSFPGWMEFATHPTIVDLVEQVIGPDIILRGTATFYKRAGQGPATAWHRDATGARGIKPLASTSVWIAASDSFIDNACLRFIPGSHKAKVVGEHVYKSGGFGERHADGTIGVKLVQGEIDETKAVDVELEAGQMVLFDIFTAHASRPNSGIRERASFALRFMPATSRYDHDATPAELSKDGYGHNLRPLILVRGADRAGNDLRRGHPGQQDS